MSDRCQHPGCTARRIGSRVYCVEHSIVNLEERLSAVEIEHFTDLQSPAPESWRPRTTSDLLVAWCTEKAGTPPKLIQARTDDIARMLSLESHKHRWEVAAHLIELANRIRALE